MWLGLGVVFGLEVSLHVPRDLLLVLEREPQVDGLVRGRVGVRARVGVGARVRVRARVVVGARVGVGAGVGVRVKVRVGSGVTPKGRTHMSICE